MTQIEELLDYSELVNEKLIPLELLPHPDASRCFVHRGMMGKIEGYIFIQLMVTVEPIWVSEKHRGNGLALKLFGTAADTLLKEGTVSYFVTHSDTEKTESYLRRLGLEELNWKTFKMKLKEFVGG